MASNRMKNVFTLIHKSFLSTVSVPNGQQPPCFTAQYLINSCGLSLQSALTASKKLKIDEKNLENPKSVLKFLNSSGLDDTQIARLVQFRPLILHCCVEKTLKPKVEYFIQNGIKGKNLANLLVTNGSVLFSSLDSRIKPSVEYLKGLFGSSNHELFIATLRRSSWLLITNLDEIVKPNVGFLMNGGVPVDRIAKLIELHPRTIIQKPDKMVHAFNFVVKELGIEPNATMFIHSLRVILAHSDLNLKKKMDVFRSLGWNQTEILLLLKMYPYSFVCSEEKIRTVVNFGVKTMKLNLESIIADPLFLMFSFDKRIRPRYNVLKVLQSKKLVAERLNIFSLLRLGEKKFLEDFVHKYENAVPEILGIYKNTSNVEANKKGH